MRAHAGMARCPSTGDADVESIIGPRTTLDGMFPENGFANHALGCGTIPSGPGPSLIRPISCPPSPSTRRRQTNRIYDTVNTVVDLLRVCLCWKRRNEGGWKTLGFVRNSRLSTQGRGRMQIRSTSKARTGRRTSSRLESDLFRRVPPMPGDRDPGACRHTVGPRWATHIHNIAINGPNMTESHAVQQRL